MIQIHTSAGERKGLRRVQLHRCLIGPVACRTIHTTGQFRSLRPMVVRAEVRCGKSRSIPTMSGTIFVEIDPTVVYRSRERHCHQHHGRTRQGTDADVELFLGVWAEAREEHDGTVGDGALEKCG